MGGGGGVGWGQKREDHSLQRLNVTVSCDFICMFL